MKQKGVCIRCTAHVNSNTLICNRLLLLLLMIALINISFAQVTEATREIFTYNIPPQKCISGICITLKEINADIYPNGTQVAYFLMTFDTKSKNNLFWNAYTKSNIEIASFDRKTSSTELLNKLDLEIYNIINERIENEIEKIFDESGREVTQTVPKYVYTIQKIDGNTAKSLQKTKYLVALKLPWTQATWNLSTMYGKIDPDITGCGTFTTSNTVYNLLNDINFNVNNLSGTQNCIYINAYNTVLNLQNKTIYVYNYTVGGSSYITAIRFYHNNTITNGTIIMDPLNFNHSSSEIAAMRLDSANNVMYLNISNLNVTMLMRGFLLRLHSSNLNYNISISNVTFTGRIPQNQTECTTFFTCGPYGIYLYSYNIFNNVIDNVTIFLPNGTGSATAYLYGFIDNMSLSVKNSNITIRCFNFTYGTLSVIGATSRRNMYFELINSTFDVCHPASFGTHVIRFESNNDNVTVIFENNTFNYMAANTTVQRSLFNVGPHNASATNVTLRIINNTFNSFNYSPYLRGNFMYYTGGTGSQNFYNGTLNMTTFYNISSYQVADVNCDGFADSGPHYPNLPGMYSATNYVDYFPRFVNTSCSQQPSFSVTIQSPQNITYAVLTIPLNYTVTNNTAVSCFYSFDLGATMTPLSNCQNTTITHSAEGFYQLRVYVTNDSNNWNFSEVNYTVLTSINLTVQRPQNITYYSLPIPINYTFQNSTFVSCHYRLNNNNWVDLTNCQNTTINTLTEGAHNITIRVNNSVRANTSTVYFTYVIPKINLTLIRPENITYWTSAIPVNYTYSHNTNETPKCYYRLDNNNFIEITACQNTTLTGVSFGSHNLTLVVNNSYTSNQSIVYFTVASPTPSINLLIPENKTYYKLPIPINYTYSSPVSPFICYYNLNDGTNVSLTNCQNSSITSLSFGSYKITIYIENEYETNSDVEYFTYRASNNNVTIINPQNITYTVNNVNLNYTYENETVIVKCEYSLNNGAWIQLTNCQNTTLTNLADQTHYLRVRITDEYDYTKIAERYFTVSTPDTTPPTITINNPKNITYNVNNIPVDYVVTDTQSGLKQCNYTLAYANGTIINFTANISCTNSFTINLQFNYTYYIKIDASDNANNVNSKIVYFTLIQQQGGNMVMSNAYMDAGLITLVISLVLIYMGYKRVFGFAVNKIILYVGFLSLFIPIAFIVSGIQQQYNTTDILSPVYFYIVGVIVFLVLVGYIFYQMFKALSKIYPPAEKFANFFEQMFVHEGDKK